MRRLAALLTALMLFPAAPAAGQDDRVYYQDVLFQWDRVEFDIVVVPPNHGQVFNGNGPLGGGDPGEATPFNSYLRAIEDSIQAWDDSLQRYGGAFLKRRFESRVYVVGRDPMPEDDEDVEILIVTDESKTVVLGFALGGDDPCIVNNSKFFIESFTYEDMFNVNAQEYGHCLGLAHVRDNQPEHDVMDGTYDDPVGAAGVHLHCPSNLNVYGLHLALGILPPNPTGAVLAASRYREPPCERDFLQR